MCCGRETNEHSSKYQTWELCGLKYGPKLEKSLKREKSKSGQSRSPNSTILESWETFISSIRKMENMKKPSKMRGESWNFQWMMQYRTRKEQRNTSRFRKLKWRVDGSTTRSCWIHNKIPKTKHACVVEVPGSTRQRLESSLPKDHEDRIASKGKHSMTHYNLAHKFIPMSEAMKISDAKAAVDKEWKSAWQLDKV